MYICLDCGYVFDEPASFVETHGFDTPPYEEWSGCPKCSGGYAQTFQCDICGEWITDEYIVLKDGTTVCENCYDEKHIEDWNL